MAFTSAALYAVNDYLKNMALSTFPIIGFRYEPPLIFSRQLREVVAEASADFAKKYKNKHWLLIGYGRQPLTYDLKRTDAFSSGEYVENYGENFEVKWKRREVNTTFKYIFISPSPELLEELEEKVIVWDLGVTLYGSANVVIRNNEKEEIYTFPFPDILVNLQKFQVENFDHIDDINEGVFSIFSMSAIVNYPVFAVGEIYDGNSGDGGANNKWCSKIHLTVEAIGEKNDEIIIIPEE